MSLVRNKLIFCGIDGTGKTPLIEEIKKAVLSDPLVKSMVAPVENVVVKQLVPDPFKYKPGETIEVAINEFDVWGSYRDTFAAQTELVLYDRFPIPDEIVYGGTQLGVNEFNAIDKIIREHAAFVYLEPLDSESYRQLMAENPDPMYPTHQKKEFDRITNGYMKFFSRTGARVIRVPWYVGRWFGEQDAIQVLADLQY